MTNSPDLPSWGLCVATYNRIDTLLLCVRFAMLQTRPPAEIVIVDASDDWAENSRKIAALVSQAPAIRLTYLQAQRRSLTAQRNQAVAASGAEVLFMIDDDSLLHADCAERIMAIYARDSAHCIAAVGAVHVEALPAAEPLRQSGRSESSVQPLPLADSVLPDRKVSGLGKHRGAFNQAFKASALFRFFWRDLLLMAAERRFVRYDDPPRHRHPEAFDAAAFPDAVPVEFISGYAITVRRNVVAGEPFDDGLVAYAAAEDLDATYRFGRHGVIVLAPQARLHHMEAASGRIKRTKAATFGLLNIAYFVRKNSKGPVSDGARVALLALRMLPAEIVKDLASGRWSMPQLGGVLLACFHLPRVLIRPPARLQPWYGDLQLAILQRLT